MLLESQLTSSSSTILAAYIWREQKSLLLHNEAQSCLLWFEHPLEMSEIKYFENFELFSLRFHHHYIVQQLCELFGGIVPLMIEA